MPHICSSMSDPPKPSYLSLPIPHFLDVFRLVEEVMRANDTPFYLLGLPAAELQLLQEEYYIEPFSSRKKWKDMDFAMRVPSLEVCERIKDQLVSKGFIEVKKPFGLRHPTYMVATELVPFGEIETGGAEDAVIEKISAKALGLREALEQSTLELLDDKLVAEVPALHGIAMLALLSWSDNPKTRGMDLRLFDRIVGNYFPVETDTVLARYDEALREPLDDFIANAAEVIGMRIAELVHKSPVLKKRLLRLVHKNNHLSKQGLAWALHRRIGFDLRYAVRIVKRLRRGMLFTPEE